MARRMDRYRQNPEEEQYGEDSFFNAEEPYAEIPPEGNPEDAYEAEAYSEEAYPEDAYSEDSYAENAYPEDAYPEEEPYGDGDAPDNAIDDAANEPFSILKPRVRKPAFILSVMVNTIRVVLVLVLLAGLAGVGAVVGIAKGYVETAPDLDLAALDDQAQTSFIYDRYDNLICEYKGTENRVMVSLEAMPMYLRNAFVAVEDARFYTHHGVDFKRIVGAFVSNLSSSSTQGGSTITQQLIKNTLLSSEQSYKRKIQEAYLAIQLEQKYTKDQILEAYLNTIYLGENYYGVQTAAEGYFGKSLGELTLRECAMLAGTTNSPYYYNPRRNYYTRHSDTTDYVAITDNRTNYVLRCMYENQFITWEQYQEALDPMTAAVLENSPSGGDPMYAYPHYVEYALGECVDILLQLNGLEDTAANRSAMESKLRTGGYRIKLAVDPDIQNIVQSTISGWTKYPALKNPSDKVFRSLNSDGTYTEIIQPQAATAVLDYRTGELKAIIGGRDEPTARRTLNRATDMNMPVGSAIKPIAVYAPALELGASPASVVYNMPLPIAGWKGSDGKDTWPRNYGGKGYVGPETLREAMNRSHNTAAAQTLMTMVGVDRSVDFLHRLGVDDDHIDVTPFGLALGSSGITPLQMTVAYGVLANGGVYQEPISVLGISDSNGQVVWDGHANQERRRVFSESTAYMIVDMLKTVITKGTSGSAKISGQTVAGKTGTNSDQKGVFFAGVTGYYASALWVGHDNYKALSGSATGSGAAAPLWQSYMAKIHQGLENRDILDGDGSQYNLVKVTTCAVSGQLATDACYADAHGYGVVTDWWANGTQPTVQCQMHANMQVCVDSGMIASPYCPNVGTRGVVTIPIGHPLYQFLGTQYQGVLEDYFGNAVSASSQMCTWHTTYVSPDENPVVENTLLPDARLLLQQAEDVLAVLDPSSAQYASLSSAMANLDLVINSANPSTSDLAAAMGLVSQAMAGFN